MEYTNKVERVTSIGFGVLSPEKIIAQSVCEVYKTINAIHNKNLSNTPNDPLLGTTSKYEKCATCNLTDKECPGHFGHTVLCKPVFLFQYKHIILKLMTCFCYKCSSYLFEDKEHKKELAKRAGKARLLYAYNYAKTSKQFTCPKCKVILPKKIQNLKDKSKIRQIELKFGKTSKDDDDSQNKLILNSEYIYNMLKLISDENVDMIGLDHRYSRPDWMIWTVIPISPLSMRPRVRQDNGKISEDDITHKLNEIIRVNNTLIEKLDNAKPNSNQDSLIDEFWDLLQYHVITSINNNMSGFPKATHRTGRALKTLTERISSKEGRIRSHLMGKRVDQSGRSVITADPSISIDELVIPLKFAVNLTYPEVVCDSNIDRLKTAIMNGNEYPGVKRVTVDNKKFSIKGMSEEQKANLANKLKNGQIVYRHLIKGDWVLFNRQPSLHKMSMMAHRIIPMEGKTLRFNPNVTSPYAGDFDGDEMNIHVMQTQTTSLESKYLASVSTQIINPQSCSPCIGLIQDNSLGCYLMTTGNIDISLQHMMSISSNIIPYVNKVYVNDNNNRKASKKITTHDIFNLLLPNINYNNNSDNVKIVNGVYNSGILSSKSTGIKNNSIFHICYNDMGNIITRDFIDNIGWVANSWLNIYGFSCGISDCIISDAKIIADINANIDKYNKYACNMIANAENGKELLYTEISKSTNKFYDYKSVKKQFPQKMWGLLGECRGNIEKIIDDYLKQDEIDNSIYKMIVSGSKGKPNNMCQILGILGPQNIDGTWIPDQLEDRTLPHNPKYSLSPETHGYIKNSYVTGLSPQEYWSHAQAGRDGVITKTIKTADSGYIQRKLIKALEDIHICYDNTVRNANNVIIQLLYGYDGINGSYLENVNIKYIRYDNETLRGLYFNSEERDVNISNEEFDNILGYISYIKDNTLKTDIGNTVYFNYDDMIIKSPINIDRYIMNIKNENGNGSEGHEDDMTAKDIFNRVKELCAKTTIYRGLEGDDKESYDIVQKINECSSKLLHMQIYTELCSKNLRKHGIAKLSKFNKLLKNIEERYINSIANGGDNVGMISAQSIGEPVTQLTLSTFHHTGIGTKVSLQKGVPRLKELLNLSKNTKTPTSVIYLSDDMKKGKNADLYDSKNGITDYKINKAIYDLIEPLKSSLEYTTVRNIIDSISINIAKNVTECYPSDFEFIADNIKFNNIIQNNAEDTPNVLIRIILNKEKISNTSNISILHIKNSIINTFNGMCEAKIKQSDVIHADLNGNENIIRINICLKTTDSNELNSLIKEINNIENIILNTVIQGIMGISKTHIRLIQKDFYYKSKYYKKIEPMNNIYKILNEDKDKTIDYVDIVIDTEGTSMQNIICCKDINPYKTYSNSVWEMYQIYGIEVARKILIKEIYESIDTGVYISPKHIEILIDVMTHQGTLISTDRHGMGKTDSGPLHRASFEETTTQLTNASIYNENDNMNGISSNIMFGQYIKTGTGAFNISLDIDKLIKNKVYKNKDITYYVNSVDNKLQSCDTYNYEFEFKFF